MRKWIYIGITLLMIICSFILGVALTQRRQTVEEQLNHDKLLNEAVKSAILNSAMLGYNVGKNGGTPMDVNLLMVAVGGGNSNALLEWADNVGRTNHTKILIVR